MIVKTAIKTFINYVAKPVALVYLSVERKYQYDNIHVSIKPGVFHPGLFFSTKLLLNYLKDLPLRNQKFLELGAGSGLISIYAARQNAIVTAIDISQIAVDNIKANAQRNNVTMSIFRSDLFETVPPLSFDIIAINPPFYPRKPYEEKDFAWYCGENYEYFDSLFIQLPDYIGSGSKTIMILSDQTEIDKIMEIAMSKNLIFKKVFQKKLCWEQFFIFEIEKETKQNN